jgi:hypothetical protein
MNTKPTPEAIATLRTLTTHQQFEVINRRMMARRRPFIELIDRIHALCQAMPKPRDDGQGCDRPRAASLHHRRQRRWIVRKDADPDHAGPGAGLRHADLGVSGGRLHLNPEPIENGASWTFIHAKRMGELLD